MGLPFSRKGRERVKTARIWAVVIGGIGLTAVPVTALAATSPSSAPRTFPTAHQSAPKPASPSAQPAPTQTQTQTQTTPAPASKAEGYAVQVQGVLAVSHTKSSASGSGTSSTANALELGAAPPASQFGGTQNGNGSSSGDLIKVNPSDQFLLAVTPWSATNSETSSGSSASGIADILVLDLGTAGSSQSASLRVLQSESNSTWTPSSSTANGSTDGAILNLGGKSGLTVDLLHSETSSSGKGSSYLVSVNGNQIGTSGQAAGKCVLAIPALLKLECLTASGGVAGLTTTATSGVAKATVGSGSNSLTGALFQSSSSLGASAKLAAKSHPASTAPAKSAAPAAPAAAPASSRLAFTGMDVAALLAVALLLIVMGGLISTRSRRPVRA